MSNAEENLLEALEGLLAERRRYEGWITQLEAKREVSPSHVVDRVRADYQARLDGVMDVLRGRATELDATSTSLTTRIAEIESEESLRRDERAETELRALVGEYADDQARDSIARCDDALGRLASEREHLSAELRRVTEILDLVRPAPVAPPVAPEPEPAAVPFEEASPPEAIEPTGPEWVAEPDELRQDAAPSEQEGPLHEEAAAVEASVERPGEASGMLDDELAFLQSVVDTREGAPVESGRGADLLPPPVLSAPKRQPTPPPMQAQQQPGPGIGNAANRGPQLTPGSIPSFFKDMPTEQVKTLRCAECGTMNYPTEWYCERCGGELAAM